MKTLPSIVLTLGAAAAVAFTFGAFATGATLISVGIFGMAFREYGRPELVVYPLETATVPTPERSRLRLAA